MVEELIDKVLSLEGLTQKKSGVQQIWICSESWTRCTQLEKRNVSRFYAVYSSAKCPMKVIVQIWHITTDVTWCSFAVYERGTHEHEEIAAQKKKEDWHQK